MKLIMSNGECLIDEDDYERVSKFRWYVASHGYVRRSSDKLYLHRFLMDANKGEQVDHINRNKLDNRKCNLRFCNQKENNMNRSKVNGKLSEYKGVCIDRVVFTSSVSGIHLGRFIYEEDAALAYNRKAKELYGEFAWLNPVEDDGRELKTILGEKKTSKRKGIYLRYDKKKWVAQVWSNSKTNYIGSFNTEEEAIEAQEKYLEKHS